MSNAIPTRSAFDTNALQCSRKKLDLISDIAPVSNSCYAFPMLWTILVILLILWVLGFSLHIAGGLIHLILVVALVVFVLQLISGRRK